MGTPRFPKTVKPATIDLNVRIEEDLYRRLMKEIGTQGRTKRDLVIQAIREYLDKVQA